mmetsp:Transcript_21498/g.49297  ORF Transcript_21498/g.49297 Transcript_21498/m.49297 type:complete len:246 (-) Transcript_21498:414-1151(-)
MKDKNTVWSVDIIPIGPKSCCSIELLPIENSWCVWINLYLEFCMTLAKTQTSSPDSIRELGFAEITCALRCVRPDLTGEGDHAQVGNLVNAVQAAGLVFTKLVDVGHVGRQHGVLVLGFVPHVYHLLVPVRFEIHVRVCGHAEVLGRYVARNVCRVNVLSQETSRVSRASGILGVYWMNEHLVLVRTSIACWPSLAGITTSRLRAEFRHHLAVFLEAAQIFVWNVLLEHTDAYVEGPFCLGEEIF